MIALPLIRRHRRRSGTATVELAICLPAIALLVFASIEACTMIFLKQSLSIACYEGLRESIRPDATRSGVLARCDEIIRSRNIAGARVDLDPANPAQVERGQDITLTVSAPSGANSLLPVWLFGGRRVTAQNTMVKE